MPPAVVSWKVRRSIAVVKAIYGASFVAMEPSAITAKRDEVRERSVSVVPHDEDERTCRFGRCFSMKFAKESKSADLRVYHALC